MLAHVEANAINLAFDIIARYTDQNMPEAFYDDWVRVRPRTRAIFHHDQRIAHALVSRSRLRATKRATSRCCPRECSRRTASSTAPYRPTTFCGRYGACFVTSISCNVAHWRV